MAKRQHSIGVKILLGYVSVFLILLMAAVTIYHATLSINKNVATFVDVTLTEMDAIERLSRAKSEQLINAYSLYGTTVELAQFDSQNQALQRDVSVALNTLVTHKSGIAHSDMNSAYTHFSQQLDRLRASMAASSVNWDQARQILNELNRTSVLLQQQLTQAKAHVSKQANEKTITIFQSISNIVNINSALVVLTFMIAVGGYILTQKFVVKPVQALSAHLQQTAQTLDLTLSSTNLSEDEVGEAARGTNQLVDAFRSGIQEVLLMMDAITESAHSLSQVSHSSENSVSQLTAEIDRLVDHTYALDKGIAEDATHTLKAAQIASNGASDMASGVELMDKTSQSITDLAKDLEVSSSMLIELRDTGDHISNVVSTIATIADQTNLLALNAAIEAARAGESGRGFAVVADEVRTLATHTHQSTTEINTILAKIVSSITASVDSMHSNQQKAAAAVHLSVDTMKNLAEVRSHILSLSHTCGEVANRAKHVRGEVGQISAAIAEFKTLGDSVAQGSAHTNQVSEQLMQSSEQLNRVAAKFKV